MVFDSTHASELVATLNAENGTDALTFYVGKGNFPEACLKLPNGASITVSLYGGQLLNWTDSKGRSICFVSEQAHYKEGKAIRGGIPIIFPWFGTVEGRSFAHGFARISPWSFVRSSQGDEPASITLRLTDSELTHRYWNHSFNLDVTFTLTESLTVDAHIKNKGATPFGFQFAFHNYFNTGSINNVLVRGVEKSKFVDKARDELMRGQTASKPLKFSGLVDRIYLGVSEPLTILGIGSYSLTLASNLPDRVTWNPGKVSSPQLDDLSPLAFEHFVCIESAIVEVPVTLPPQGSWKGSQKISIDR